MLKSFAAAITPIVVLGRGTNDGASEVNAYEVDLIKDVLTLYTYNINNDGVDEFHGDLSYKSPTTYGEYLAEVEFGCCFRKSAITY